MKDLAPSQLWLRNYKENKNLINMIGRKTKIMKRWVEHTETTGKNHKIKEGNMQNDDTLTVWKEHKGSECRTKPKTLEEKTKRNGK